MNLGQVEEYFSKILEICQIFQVTVSVSLYSICVNYQKLQEEIQILDNNSSITIYLYMLCVQMRVHTLATSLCNCAGFTGQSDVQSTVNNLPSLTDNNVGNRLHICICIVITDTITSSSF